MKPVERGELLSLSAYEQVRERFRSRVIEHKQRRRLALGRHMSLVFEDHDTVLLQIQEMLRTERITDERAIAHEIATYNELIPAPGSLSGTLFIEYDDPIERKNMLGRLASLRTSVHLSVGQQRVTARFGTHFGEELDRLPAVCYLAFELGSEARAALRDSSMPAAIEITHPAYPVSVPLPAAHRAELIHDLED
jgi:hypothetical protein